MKQILFQHLSQREQQEVIWQCGFVIGLRKDDKYAYVLYSLNDFLVELQYEGKRIKNIQSFTWQQQAAIAARKSQFAKTCSLARPPLQVALQLN